MNKPYFINLEFKIKYTFFNPQKNYANIFNLFSQLSEFSDCSLTPCEKFSAIL